MSFAVGESFGTPATRIAKAGKVVAHGVVGGLQSVVRRGKFMAGFLAGGFAEATSGLVGSNFVTREGRIAAAAVLGGAGSVLGGGKFANGAITGAFQRLFNHELHPEAFRKGDGNYHHYENLTVICGLGTLRCTLEEVFTYLRRFAAPGQDSDIIVETGDKTTVVPRAGDVYHIVDIDNFSVSNWTLPGHLLHFGVIDRMLIIKDGSIYIYTHGEGTGNLPRLNEVYGKILFSTVDHYMLQDFSEDRLLVDPQRPSQ